MRENKEIEKLRIGKYIEHCSLCDICIMSTPENCQGIAYNGESWHCVKCDTIICENCKEKHDRLCNGLVGEAWEKDFHKRWSLFEKEWNKAISRKEKFDAISKFHKLLDVEKKEIWDTLELIKNTDFNYCISCGDIIKQSKTYCKTCLFHLIHLGKDTTVYGFSREEFLKDLDEYLK